MYYLLFIIFIFKIILGKGKNYESKQLTNIYCKRIRYLRLTKGLSQEKLSELAGLGSKHIHNIENEKYNFQIQTLNKILIALEVDEKHFLISSFQKKQRN